MLPNDPLARVLYIDLSKRRFWVKDRSELFKKGLGGAGVAIELLHEECPAGLDPISGENPIIFAVGPLTALYPLASKTVAMFKSPHTGNLGESHAGGRSAVALRLAGYGAIVIRGESTSPIYLAIYGDQVHFRDASSLWGIRSSFTVGRLIRQREGGAGTRTIMRIGRAGEAKVSYACVTTEAYRHFGRLGLGAVLGAKKLKAIAISGSRSIPVSDRKLYRRVYDEIYRAAVESPVMRKYHDLGTAGNIIPLNEIKALPARNLQNASLDQAARLSGESLAEGYLGRRVACSHCPVGCIHLAALREPSDVEPYFYKTSMICYDYEPIYALGTMLGGADPVGMLRLMDAIETYALDAMTTGVVLAWATEAMEKHLISERETNGVALKWGDYSGYINAVRFIVEQPNEFYKTLAKGVEAAAARYGGEDFALAFGGNEMPGYHTGPAAHLNYLTGARHSHLDSAGYSIDQKALSASQPQTPKDVAEALLKEEQWRQILSSLVICYFARGIYTPKVVLDALQTAGVELSEAVLPSLGARILARKHEFKLREGFSLKKIRIPKRIFETPTPMGTIREQFMREAIELFERQLMALSSSGGAAMGE